ncbi:MAG: NAD(P)-dependent oxidoreductase [Anaerolineae bacterium]|nr:NAD(P)-dependent oxidoreductase [Anaerolineae bacterium]
MKILVTGGLGGIGRVTVARLLRHGHEVLALDCLPEADVEQDVWDVVRGAEYSPVDIRDFEALRPHFAGMDAVIHLAALPDPNRGTEVEIFHVNCTGSFNVYRAAADAGIRRVVSASSINALGYNYSVRSFPIQYFPIDEAHPTFTSDPYSFSKQVLEETAAYFWRRERISGVCLRFPFVFHTTAPWAEQARGFSGRWRQAFEELMALSETERRARIDPLVAEFEAQRSERLAERPWSGDDSLDQGISSPEQMLMFGRSDFWTIISGEDAALALERGVLAIYEGSHPLFICDNENVLGVSSQQLAELFFPEVTVWTRPVEGVESLVSSDCARRLIGFESEHSIQAWLDQD